VERNRIPLDGVLVNRLPADPEGTQSMAVSRAHNPAAGPSGAGAAAASTDASRAPDLREAIFGSFDGMTSTLGVIAGLLATHANASHIVAGAIGISVAATIGMGAGQYLSDDQRNLRKAFVMALATLIGSILPAVPFFFGRSTACIVASIAITLAAASVIGHYRGYVVTYTILIVVSALTVGLSIAVA
jgi:VIT1/CCC1 family predicted Fe2+/Mn2+ transporter